MRRSKTSTFAETDEIETGLLHLAPIARPYHKIESRTTCQAGKNYLPLSVFIGNLRNTMLPRMVERMMFIRLHMLFVPEVIAHHDAIEAKTAAEAKWKENVGDFGAAVEGSTFVLCLLAFEVKALLFGVR